MIEGLGAARAKAVDVDNFGNVYIGNYYENDNSIDNAGNPVRLENFGVRDTYLAS